MPATKPTIYIMAGCNGAGKTTFAKEFLPHEVKCLRFYNADEIARGLSPLDPSGKTFDIDLGHKSRRSGIIFLLTCFDDSARAGEGGRV
jgi:predicted ABC-type ATPase